MVVGADIFKHGLQMAGILNMVWRVEAFKISTVRSLRHYSGFYFCF